MDKLIALVSEKTGIEPDKAKTAVTTVLGFLKDRVPAPLASQIDNVINKDAAEEGEDSGEGGGLGDAAKKLGGLFGG